MPKYKIQLKQGKRTLVAYGEFKSVASVLAIYQRISTLKVTEILKIEYEDETIPPIDDFNYRSQFKGMIKNNTNRMTKQVVLNNIKMSISENDIYQACKEHMEINALNVDSIFSVLFKK